MFSSRVLLVVLAAAGAAPTISAQAPLCVGDDGLTGPCCAATVLTLPAFPGLTMDGIAPTWTSCFAPTPVQAQVRLTPPAPTARCGEFTVQLEVVDLATASPVMAGTLVLDYTRTFGESNDADAAPEYQVWRFAAKVDLAGLAPFSATPPCVGPSPAAFYYGYVDYAQKCGAAWESALVLFHNCDRFMHAPGLSAVPGVFHPGQSFAVVAPSTAANPFLVQPLLPIGGVAQDEGLRTLPLAGAPCTTEERLVNGNLLPLARGCGCSVMGGPRQVSVARFMGTGSCPDLAGNPGRFEALNVGPAGLPWVRMVTTSLGGWTTLNAYPGPERASVNEGFFFHHDTCANGGAGQSFIELSYGATTSGGYDLVVPPAAAQPTGMVDMASNYALPVGAPPIGPFLGRVLDTRHLIYTNVY
jgi:hypothetical protein